MGDIVFIVPSLEWEGLVVSPVREFHLDLGLFLLLVEVHRLNVRDRGLYFCLHSESLSPSSMLFAFALMIGTISDLVSKKDCLKLLFGGDIRIQSSVSLEILMESKILDIGSNCT